MSKKHDKADDAAAETKKERNRRYEKELTRLQVELAHLQSWVKATGARARFDSLRARALRCARSGQAEEAA